ncbi:unnamed protein product, partial [Urochloa humidicola]
TLTLVPTPPLSPTGGATPQSPPRVDASPHALPPTPPPHPHSPFRRPIRHWLHWIQSPRAASARHSPAARAAEWGYAAVRIREGGGAQRWPEGGFTVVGTGPAVKSEARGLAQEARVAADVRGTRVRHTQPSEPRRTPTGARKVTARPPAADPAHGHTVLTRPWSRPAPLFGSWQHGRGRVSPCAAATERLRCACCWIRENGEERE